jgi:hypothetical protein
MINPKEEAEKIFDFTKRTINYFVKDIDNDTLKQLAKQISLNQIKYTSDKFNDNSTSSDIFNIKKEIESL